MGAQLKPARRLNAKGLPAPQAVTVLALKSLSAGQDARTIALIYELAEWGMRPRLILKLVGNAARATIKAMVAKAQGAKTTGGRLPSSLGEIMYRSLGHLEASIFLRKYIGFLRIDGLGRRVDYEVFIQAYRDYRASVSWMTRLPPRISPEVAFLIVEQYAVEKILLNPCPECTIYFVQTQDIVRVGSEFTRGSCPFCKAAGRRRRT